MKNWQLFIWTRATKVGMERARWVWNYSRAASIKGWNASFSRERTFATVYPLFLASRPLHFSCSTISALTAGETTGAAAPGTLPIRSYRDPLVVYHSWHKHSPRQLIVNCTRSPAPRVAEARNFSGTIRATTAAKWKEYVTRRLIISKRGESRESI